MTTLRVIGPGKPSPKRRFSAQGDAGQITARLDTAFGYHACHGVLHMVPVVYPGWCTQVVYSGYPGPGTTLPSYYPALVYLP